MAIVIGIGLNINATLDHFPEDLRQAPPPSLTKRDDSLIAWHFWPTSCFDSSNEWIALP